MIKNDNTETVIDITLFKFIEFMKKHPIFIYNITASVGLILVFFYFIKINYFPSLNVDEIILLTLISSLIGVFLFILLLIYFSAPSILYKGVREKELNDIFYFENDSKKTLRHDLWTIALPFFLFMFTFYIESKTEWLKDKVGPYWALIWIAFQIIVPSIIWFCTNRTKYLKKYIGYVLMLIISEFSLFASLFVYFSFLKKSDSQDETYIFIVFILASIFVFIVNFIKIKKFIIRFLLNTIILITIILLTNSYYIIPYKIMEVLSLGQIPIKKLFIQKTGCTELGIITNDYCVLKNYKLIWRLGDTFVVEKKLKIEKNSISYQRYYIPKKYILSWEQELIKKRKRT
jgi:hypothetical protein